MNRLSKAFNTIGLIWKKDDAAAEHTLSKVIHYFQKSDAKLLSCEACADLPEEAIVPFDHLANHADLIITVGGDGTIIQTARRLSEFSGKLIGINQGRLGFLADISPDDFHSTLDQILQGQYFLEERFLLEVSVQRHEHSVFSSKALNDVVVHKWSNIRMIELETAIDGAFVNRHRSDGLIVATPTGSTAYALSAGGPILYPTLNALLLVPISPHRLSHRAITVNGDSTIEIKVCGGKMGSARVTCDGQDDFELQLDDIIRVTKSPRSIKILHPKDHNHFSILKEKLGWG